MKQEVNVHGLVLGKVLVKKFILYRDTVILAMSDRFVVCYRPHDLLEQSVTALSSATDLVTCWNSDKYVALKVTRETCYVLALPG
jgi:hypothetical protein